MFCLSVSVCIVHWIIIWLCINFRKLAGYTIFITGASRGIGKAIALKAARDGANVVIAAKTADPHPKLPGTIYTAAAESERRTRLLLLTFIIGHYRDSVKTHLFSP